MNSERYGRLTSTVVIGFLLLMTLGISVSAATHADTVDSGEFSSDFQPEIETTSTIPAVNESGHGSDDESNDTQTEDEGTVETQSDPEFWVEWQEKPPSQRVYYPESNIYNEPITVRLKSYVPSRIQKPYTVCIMQSRDGFFERDECIKKWIREAPYDQGFGEKVMKIDPALDFVEAEPGDEVEIYARIAEKYSLFGQTVDETTKEKITLIEAASLQVTDFDYGGNSNEVNAVELYKKTSSGRELIDRELGYEPFVEFPIYGNSPSGFGIGLNPNDDYVLVAYSMDMLVDSKELQLTGGETKVVSLGAPDYVDTNIEVYKSDGETPLKDANVEVRTHEAFRVWRDVNTGDDGSVEVSLQPSIDENNDDQYYDITVKHDGNEVGSDRIYHPESETREIITDVVPDSDNDGIPDNSDQCPDRKEDKDGYDDDDGCPENPAPSVTLSDASAPEGGTTPLTARANDPERDSLSYDWSADKGSISSSGSSVTYNAPSGISSSIQDTVSVTVTEPDGGKTGSDSATVTVNNDGSNDDSDGDGIPDGSDPCPEEAGDDDDYDVGCSENPAPSVTLNGGNAQEGGTTLLTADATDPEGDSLSYDWSADKGSIPGSGSSVTYNAPSGISSSIDDTVTVTVTEPDAGKTDDASATVEVTRDTPPANFDVSIDSTNSPVQEGETVTVDATVTNTGGESDSQTIRLDAGPLGLYTEDESLGGGESSSVTFSVPTGSGDAGKYQAEVKSEDDNAFTDIVVEDGTGGGGGGDPFFEVSIDETNSPVDEGETLTVGATITNTGDGSGTQSVGLNINGLGSDTELVKLDEGESADKSFSVPTGSGDAGNYRAEIETEDDSASTGVAVEDGTGGGGDGDTFFEVSIDETNSPVEAGEDLEIDVVVENTGQEPGSQDIAVETDGLSSGTFSVNLASGSSRNLNLFSPTEENDAGVYTLTVISDDDRASTLITIEGDNGGDSDNPSGVDQYRDDPGNPNSPVSTSGIQDAISDFVNNDIGTGMLQKAINEFVSTQ